MRVIFFIVIGIFLFFTAPIWVPIVGILGLVGAGTVIVGGVEASHAARQEVPVVTSAVAETQSTSDQVAAPGQVESEAAAKAKQLATETAAIEESTQASADIASVPTAEPTAPVGPAITNLGLPGALNDTFRRMIQNNGKHCNAITDHVWVTNERISIMCDRRLRMAFVRGPDGWRFGRPGE
jgi:hypothetical protein